MLKLFLKLASISVFLFCSNHRTNTIEQALNMFEIKPAIFKSGKFIPLLDSINKDRTACLLKIRNNLYDTVLISENSVINDTIFGVDPVTFIQFNKKDSSTIVSKSYLTNINLRKRIILRGDSTELLLFNAKYFERDSMDYYNEYILYFIDSNFVQSTVLKIKSSSLNFILTKN